LEGEQNLIQHQSFIKQNRNILKHYFFQQEDKIKEMDVLLFQSNIEEINMKIPKKRIQKYSRIGELRI